MRKINLLNIFIIICFLSSCSSKSEKDKWVKESATTKYSKKREVEVWGSALRGNNPALFYGTPLYDLADAMTTFPWFRSERKIENLIEEISQKDINFQEGKYGMTIGDFALRTRNPRAIRLLLDKGLNPNILKKDGGALIIEINEPSNIEQDEVLKTLKYMIKKGANVNLFSKNYRSHTPLIEAAKWDLSRVKILVEAGADPNLGDTGIYFTAPLSAALGFGKIEIVNFLIFDQKVDYKAFKYPLTSKFYPGDYTILHELREINTNGNLKKYNEKMKLINYLKTQGLDYYNIPTNEQYISNQKLSR